MIRAHSATTRVGLPEERHVAPPEQAPPGVACTSSAPLASTRFSRQADGASTITDGVSRGTVRDAGRASVTTDTRRGRGARRRARRRPGPRRASTDAVTWAYASARARRYLRPMDRPPEPHEHLARARGLPADALGLGLRVPHYGYLFEHWPARRLLRDHQRELPRPGAPPRAQKLERVRARYPIVLHGVGLNLLGHAPLDEAYLDALCRLADRRGRAVRHRSPVLDGRARREPPRSAARAVRAASSSSWPPSARRTVQRRLGRPFGLENLSSYVAFRELDDDASGSSTPRSCASRAAGRCST